MNKRVLIIAVIILFLIALSIFVKNDIRNVQKKEIERADSLEKNEKFSYDEDSIYWYEEPYDESSIYLYEEPDDESNYLYKEPDDNLEYKFIQ